MQLTTKQSLYTCCDKKRKEKKNKWEKNKPIQSLNLIRKEITRKYKLQFYISKAPVSLKYNQDH